jgi:hypothetical protein
MQMPPGFGNALEPCSDIDALTENVVAFDQDIAKIDPDPEQHTSILRDIGVPLGHHGLHSYRTLSRIDHGGKLKQQAVPGGLNNATTMFCHDDGAEFTKGTGGADFIEAHKRE